MTASTDAQTDGAPMVGEVPSWTFEPGHTEAGFRARHMMVTWVRGLFKDNPATRAEVMALLGPRVGRS